MTGELFSRWTPAERWLAGLLWADGHLATTGRSGGDWIALNLTDEDVVEAAAEVIGPDHRRYPSQQAKNPAYLPLHRLAFVDQLGALARLGFGPKPDRLWPSDLASGAFLRGLFDGDGCVSRHSKRPGRHYLRTIMCGPPALLAGMQVWLAGQGISPKRIYWAGDGKGGGGWRVQWQHRDSECLAKVMYSEPGPCMARKHARFYSQDAP